MLDISLAKPRTARIMWDDDDWDRLTEIVYPMRRNSPTDSLVKLANRAQEQFPKEHRRVLQTNEKLGPLIERIRKRDRQQADLAEEAERLRSKLTFFEDQPTREQIIAGLTEREVIERFQMTVLKNLSPVEVLAKFTTEEITASIAVPDLVGIAAKRLTEELLSRELHPIVELPAEFLHRFSSNGNGKAPAPRPAPKPVLKNLVFFGLKPNQIQRVYTALKEKANVTCVDKNRNDGHVIPQNVDYVLIWVAFTPHSYKELAKAKLPASKIINHTGGLNQLVARAEALCTI